MAAALFPQERQRCLRDPQSAEQVGLQLRACLGLGEFLDHAEVAVTGVVDHYVQAPEPLGQKPGNTCNSSGTTSWPGSSAEVCSGSSRP